MRSKQKIKKTKKQIYFLSLCGLCMIKILDNLQKCYKNYCFLDFLIFCFFEKEWRNFSKKNHFCQQWLYFL